MCTFYMSPLVKSIGFFLLGFFHYRVPLSFCHSTELCADKDKSKIATFITFIDSGLIMVAALVFSFVDKNVQHLLEIMFYIGTFGVVMFILIIPESPRFLFMNDPNSKEGIKVLNHISWFNSSEVRIPEDATFDQ